MKIRLALFWEMFKISLFVVGGGFAILAVADDRFSRKLKWTKEGEIVSHLPVFQMVPGIIAGSTAIYVGRKIAGASGAACALMGAIIPSIAVFSAVSAGYSAIPVSDQWMVAVFTGLRAALTGVIAAMVVKTWRKCLSGPASYAVLAVSLAAIGPGGANPAVVVAAAAVAGVALECARRRDSGKGASFASSIWAFPLVFIKYGSIAFGGGYVLVPAYVRDFVGASAPYLQLSGSEFADVMALTQATPGPISVNCATFFGYRLGEAAFASSFAGVACAVAATLFLLLPGSILLYVALGSLEKFKSSIVVKGILSGVRPVASAMMLNALWTFLMMTVVSRDPGGGAAFSPVAAVLAAACAAAAHFKVLGIVRMMALSAVAAVAAHFAGIL